MALQTTHPAQEKLATPLWCGFFYVPQEPERWKCCETGPTVFLPYPGRVERESNRLQMSFQRQHFLLSYLLRPWELFRPGFEPATSCLADRRSPNLANQAADVLQKIKVSKKQRNLPHSRFWGGDISDVSGCCLSRLLFLAEGVTEETLTVFLIFNHWLQRWLLMFRNKFFRLHFFLAVSTFTRGIPSFSVDPKDHWDCRSKSSMSQWSPCGSTNGLLLRKLELTVLCQFW